MFFFLFFSCFHDFEHHHSYYPQIILTPQILPKIPKYIKLHFYPQIHHRSFTKSPNTSSCIFIPKYIANHSKNISTNSFTHHTSHKSKINRPRTDRPHISHRSGKKTSQRSGAGRPPPHQPHSLPPGRLGLRRRLGSAAAPGAPPPATSGSAARLGSAASLAACPAARRLAGLAGLARRLPGRAPPCRRRPASRGRRRKKRGEGGGRGEENGWRRLRLRGIRLIAKGWRGRWDRRDKG
uniref:Uncharacterized protein n=1 Tax=Oryza sativa subsp. japonica TaxID=39947 RepID=Q69ND4_ORYSJ|nr:hypothetical protein [Oryza sativa Japonica Group]